MLSTMHFFLEGAFIESDEGEFYSKLPKEYEKNSTGKFGYTFPKHIHIYLNRECPHKCKHCFRFSSPGTALFADKSLLIKFLNRIEGIVPQISFTGGDPLSHPDFIEILEFSKKKFSVNVMSSLAYEDLKAEIFDGVDLVSVGVYGANQKEYEEFTQVPNTYEKVWKNVEIILSQGIPVRVTHALQANRIKSVRKIIEKCIAVGVPEFQLGMIFPVGRAKNYTEIFGYPEGFNYSSFLTDLIGIYGSKINIIEDFESNSLSAPQGLCGAGITNVDLDELGNIHPCLFGGGKSSKLGSISDENIFRERKIIPISVKGAEKRCPLFDESISARNEIMGL